MSDGTGIEHLWLVRKDEGMDRGLLAERLMDALGNVLEAWDNFGPEAAPVLRYRYGRYVIVMGVEFAKEGD